MKPGARVRAHVLSRNGSRSLTSRMLVRTACILVGLAVPAAALANVGRSSDRKLPLSTLAGVLGVNGSEQGALAPGRPGGRDVLRSRPACTMCAR